MTEFEDMSSQYSLVQKVFVKHLGTRIKGRIIRSPWWKKQIPKNRSLKQNMVKGPACSKRWHLVWGLENTSPSKASPLQVFWDTWKSLKIPLGSFIHWPVSLPHSFQLTLWNASFIHFFMHTLLGYLMLPGAVGDPGNGTQNQTDPIPTVWSLKLTFEWSDADS